MSIGWSANRISDCDLQVRTGHPIISHTTLTDQRQTGSNSVQHNSSEKGMVKYSIKQVFHAKQCRFQFSTTEDSWPQLDDAHDKHCHNVHIPYVRMW